METKINKKFLTQWCSKRVEHPFIVPSLNQFVFFHSRRTTLIDCLSNNPRWGNEIKVQNTRRGNSSLPTTLPAPMTFNTYENYEVKFSFDISTIPNAFCFVFVLYGCSVGKVNSFRKYDCYMFLSSYYTCVVFIKQWYFLLLSLLLWSLWIRTGRLWTNDR